LRRLLSRRLFWVSALALGAAGLSVFDEGSGIPAWTRLRDDLSAARARIELLRGEIGSLRGEVEAIGRDEFALECAIREDLGLARPGESIVRLARRPGPGAR
jgi:cell division protein FtsB